MGGAAGRIANNLSLPAGLAGAASIGGIVAAGKGIVDVSAQFEKFETILKTVEGSAPKAKVSMGWVQQFAATTPYELAEVTDAFVKLKTYGIDPQSGALKAAGDAAAAMGKPLNQAVEALADAMMGENERLKELGISASKVGDKIVYQWVENGKEMAAKADANSKKQILATVSGIWNRRYKGAMDELSQTWGGITSNLGDQWSKFVLNIGRAGVFDHLKGKVSGLLEKFNQAEKDGRLQRWAESLSRLGVGALERFETAIQRFEPDRFLQQIDDAGAAFERWTGYIGGTQNALILLGGVMMSQTIVAIGSIIGAVGRLGAVFLGIAYASTPLALVAGGVLSLGIAGYKIYNDWDKIKSGLLEYWAELKVGWLTTWEDSKAAAVAVVDYIGDRFDALGRTLSEWADRISSTLSHLWNNPMDAARGFFDNLPTWMGGSGGIKSGPMLPEAVSTLAEKIAGRFELNPNLVRAVIQAESRGNPNAVSPAGAQGLMQLMPDTAKRWGVRNPFDPEQNVRGGTAYLDWLISRYKGNIPTAVAAYHAGEGNVDKGNIGPATRAYVADVMSRFRGLEARQPVVNLPDYRAAAQPLEWPQPRAIPQSLPTPNLPDHRVPARPLEWPQPRAIPQPRINVDLGNLAGQTRNYLDAVGQRFEGLDLQQPAPDNSAYRAAARPSLIQPAQRVEGAIDVNFNDAPQGLRVLPRDTPRGRGIQTRANVGYRNWDSK